MRLFHKFYDDGAAAGGGVDTVPVPKSEYEAFQKFQQNSNKTPEEIQHDAEVENANFRQYSVANNLMKNDDFSSLDRIKKLSDRDLVYSDFCQQWDADNPDGKDEDRELAFNTMYQTTSESKTLKERGEKLIKQQAELLRTPLESKYQSAKSRYDEEKVVKADYPGFQTFISEVIKENTPEKIVVKTKDGDEEIDVDVPLTEEQRAEITKIFNNVKNFKAYLEGKDKKDDVKKAIAKKIQGYIRENNYDKGIARAFELGKGRGVKGGSDNGSENTFGMHRENSAGKKAVPNTDVMQQVFDSFEQLRAQKG